MSSTSSPSTPPAVTFRYLQRFRCVGSACEDDCCTGWRIEVDDETRHRLPLLSSRRDAPPELVALAALSAKGDDPARLPLKGDGSCVLLDGERLCALQRFAGEEALPLGCALFPRRVGRVHGRLELTATAACPEIARLLLLDEAATRVEELPQPPPRLPPSLSPLHEITDDEEHPLRRHYQLVRAALLQLLESSAHSVDERLFFIAYLGASIHPYYRADWPPAPGVHFPLESLRHELGLVLHDEAQAHLARSFADVPFDPSVARVVLENVRLLAVAASPRMAPLLDAALVDCADPSGDLEVALDGRPRRVSTARAAALHRQRRAALPAEAASRLDGAIARYLENLVVHAGFLATGNLFLHHMGLLVRVALLRFLVLAQPGVPASPELLDRAIVAVFSTVTRAYDHDAGLTTALHDAIKALGPSSPVHAARLLRF